MADFVLKDGTEITFDLDAVSISEYRQFAKGAMTEEQDDEIIARASGLPLETIRKMGQETFRRFLQAFFMKSTRPLDDPN
jgi:hypothetical protein